MTSGGLLVPVDRSNHPAIITRVKLSVSIQDIGMRWAPLMTRSTRIGALQTNKGSRKPCQLDTVGGISAGMTSVGNRQSHFRTTESFNETGGLCLSLIGELDFAVADDLATRLHQLDEQGLEVRLDLTQLAFIDSAGVRALTGALDSSRRDGSRLSVGTDMTRAVRLAIEIIGVGSYFRPDSRQRSTVARQSAQHAQAIPPSAARGPSAS